ncbi:hypothetical protein C2E23DRAFT_723963 [Lenzites betulinus]|nr:hypothetical protein C2E23DRAFT_723963 [Lenzites betulinus]
MRQRGMSEEDCRFRRALENLRVKSCTNADRALFRSRIIHRSRSLSIHSAGTTSIITARNSHRDAINDVGSKAFAVRCGRELRTFRSIDSWGVERASRSVRRGQLENDSSINPVRTSNIIHPTIQTMLWDIPPCMTEQHAGTLRICIGMPVLLKNNEATELCATNGAEGIVHDWQISCGPHGEERLDVLFVRLTNPPKTIQIQGLPLNVVPIPRTKVRVKCPMPTSERHVNIDREQVMVLPNFAMSDFASQGRTRPQNPCHLKYCRTSQSLYTCLSRSASLVGTIIIGDFDEGKMVGGLSVQLQREFIDFEVLDDITRWMYEGKLPSTFPRSYRSEAISAFFTVQGESYRPPNMHDSLDWTAYRSMKPGGCPLEWKLLSKVRSSHSASRARTSNKRKNSVDDGPEPRRDYSNKKSTNKKSKTAHAFPPSGFVWDSQDYSCAYDSVLTILLNVWTDRKNCSLNQIAGLSPALDELYECFAQVHDGLVSQEQGRNRFRDYLYEASPTRFPRHGHALTAVSDILEKLVKRTDGYGYRVRRCVACTRVDIDGCHAHPYPDRMHLSTRVVNVVSGGPEGSRGCKRCGNSSTTSTFIFDVVPPMLCIELYPIAQALPFCIDRFLQMDVNGCTRTWSLRGLIYWGSDHFTSRYIDRSGDVWYNDGITTGSECILEQGENLINLACARDRSLTHAIFVLND